MKRIAALLLSISFFASCQTPPVWRSAAYGPDNPVPTLDSAGVYEFRQTSTSINMTGVDLGDALKGIGNWAAENPDQVLEGAMNLKNQSDAIGTLNKQIAAAGPSMQKKALEFLKSQGFEIESDPGRAANHNRDHMKAADFAFVAAGTSFTPFGIISDDSREGEGPVDGSYPLFGSQTRENTVEKLSKGRAREAYASVYAAFRSPSNSPSKGLSCHLVVQVLDNNAEQAFEGRAVGTVGAGAGPQAAFDAALGQMQNPVVQ